MTMKNYPVIKSFGVKLNFLVLEILKEMEGLKENSKQFMEESGQCKMEMVWKVD
jgi:hypothetical protein